MKNNSIDLKSILNGLQAYPTYLDEQFGLNGIPKTLTVIMATFNRTPFDPDSDEGLKNPLKWSLDSVLDQHHSPVKEIILINDLSNDFTEKIAEIYEKKFESRGIEFQYVKNKEKLLSHGSRNKGAELATTKFVHFLDDDCVHSPYNLWAGIFLFDKLSEENSNLAVVGLPIYKRATVPRLLKKEKIGRLDEEKGIIYPNFGNFPEEYTSINNILLKDTPIIKPFEIHDIPEGNSIIALEPYKEFGGYQSFYPNSLGEGAALAFKLRKNGYKLFFTPDPRFHTVHLLYGHLSSNSKLSGPDWKEWNGFNKPHLYFMVDQSNISQMNSGGRVPTDVWFYSKIRNHMLILKNYSEEVAERWKESAYNDFVVKNSTWGRDASIQDFNKRKLIWETAINHANNNYTASSVEELTKTFN